MVGRARHEVACHAVRVERPACGGAHFEHERSLAQRSEDGRPGREPARVASVPTACVLGFFSNAEGERRSVHASCNIDCTADHTVTDLVNDQDTILSPDFLNV